MRASSRFALAALVCAIAVGAPALDQPKTPPARAEAAKPEAAKEAATKTEAPTAPPAPTPVLSISGFQTPESVLYDAAGDRYLVSNIGGSPLDKDNNGYISVVKPDGTIKTEKWIAGGENGVTLNAPKGTAIVKGVLYVADIDVVRLFDAKSGKPIKQNGEIAFEGASFLNDVVASKAGKVYVSDSGLKAGAKDFEPTGTDAVWVIAGKKATKVAAAPELSRPNGLFFKGNDLYVNTFGAAEIYKLDLKTGAKVDTTILPNGGLDGLHIAADGTTWVSSWAASAIYKGKLGGGCEIALPNIKAPADFGYDSKRKRLLVPRFMENTVEVYEVK
jgi:sugar lactone lactonase YvrE